MKRGLSTIVTTLIIILIVFVAIGIVWGMVSGVIKTTTQEIEIKNSFFNQDMRIQSIQFDDTNPLNVSIILKTLKGEIIVDMPETPAEPVILPNDVVSVVDVSGSMRWCRNIDLTLCTCSGNFSESSGTLAVDCNTIQSDEFEICNACGGTLEDRLGSAQDANKELINKLFEIEENQNNLGLSVYNSEIANTVWQNYSISLTKEITPLNNTINSWEAYGGTCICCGINYAKTLLENSPDETYKTMIVMSDGEANGECSEQNTGNSIDDAIQAAVEANASLKNLKIHTIGLGLDASEETLTQIAMAGNGFYYNVEEIEEIVQIYEDIAQEINSNSISTFNFAHLKVIFYTQTDSAERILVDLPGLLETRSYLFDLTTELPGQTIIKIEIYPVYVSPVGKVTIGPLFDSWEA